ncbi:hypothetical protein Tco_1565798, partial [Tanacetum coccineum]
MFVELIKKYDDSSDEELEEDDNVVTGEELGVEYFEKFLTRSELAYHNYLMCAPILSLFLRNPIIVGGRRVRGMHVFVGNFTYVLEFVIFKDISSVIDTRLSQVVLGKPFVELSNMTYDLSLGIVKFTNESDEIAYKMAHKIEKFNSLSDLEKEHTPSVYFRNEEDKKRGVDYVMNNILGFYNECLELRPEYLTRLEGSSSGDNMTDEGVT